VMEVLNENSEVQARTAVKPKGGANDLEIDMEKVPPGDYRLNVALLTQGGEELSAQQFELHKLPERTPQPTVYIDGHNRTLVNGQPFFPLAWYFGPGPTDKDFREHIDRIAASPFNTIMCYGINSGSTGDVRAYLDYLASHHLKLIYSIKDIYEGVGYNGETVLGFKGEENIVRGVVQVFRDHPAVLAWYLDDELPLTMRDRLEARQRLVSRLDTNHPTWAVLCEPADLPGYLNTADVLGTDPYPIPAKPVSMAGDWTQTSTDASAGLRPLWMVPQAFDWANYPKEWKEQGRAPTLAEELVMTYLCLIHGAHGLIFYSYFDLLHDRAGFEKRWADMLVVGREVKQLEPALLSTAKPPGFSVKVSDGSVQFAWRADDRGNAYLLLANPDPARNAWVSLVAPAGSQVRILRRAVERAVALSTSTNVYKIELAPIDAATVIVSPAR